MAKGPSSSAITETLAMLSSPMIVVGRDNGLVAGSAEFASLVPEAPRVLVALTKANLTHDLVLASRAFVLHTLPATPHAALMNSLSLVHTLGMRSGHDGDKMPGISCRAQSPDGAAANPHRPGVIA